MDFAESAQKEVNLPLLGCTFAVTMRFARITEPLRQRYRCAHDYTRAFARYLGRALTYEERARADVPKYFDDRRCDLRVIFH